VGQTVPDRPAALWAQSPGDGLYFKASTMKEEFTEGKSNISCATIPTPSQNQGHRQEFVEQIGIFSTVGCIGSPADDRPDYYTENKVIMASFGVSE